MLAHGGGEGHEEIGLAHKQSPILSLQTNLAVIISGRAGTLKVAPLLLFKAKV